jgi:hypothetical protein
MGKIKEQSLGIPKTIDTYNTFQIHHAAHLLKTNWGRKALRRDLDLTEIGSKFQLINVTIVNVLNKINLRWFNWGKI